MSYTSSSKFVTLSRLKIVKKINALIIKQDSLHRLPHCNVIMAQWPVKVYYIGHRFWGIAVLKHQSLLSKRQCKKTANIPFCGSVALSILSPNICQKGSRNSWLIIEIISSLALTPYLFAVAVLSELKV